MPNEIQEMLMRQFALLPIDARIDILKADVHKLEVILDSAKNKLAIEQDIWGALEKPDDDDEGDSK